MTQRDSGQDFDPKHRIIGAIVVVALAVIVIPMILSDRESTTDEPAAPAAAPDGSPAEENKVAVTKLAPAAPAGDASGSASTQTPSDKEPAANSTAESAGSKTPAPTPTQPAVSRQTDSKPPSSGWVVQVGTFSNAANAARLEQKLRAQRQPVLTERVDVNGTSAVRLRVGPFRDRAAALKARERINKDVGVKGVVLAYP